MRKLYEIFKLLWIKKRIVAAATIWGNTVCHLFFLGIIGCTYIFFQSFSYLVSSLSLISFFLFSVPYSLVFSLPKNEMVKVLDLNHDLQESINKLAMPKTKFFNYDILEGATAPARVKLLLPPGFREEELYTFALVVQV